MKTKTRSTGRSAEPKDHPPLPPGCRGLMNRKQVCVFLGLISLRKLDEMISVGEFPRADKRVGRSPRWSIEAANRAVHDLPPYDGLEPEA